MNRLKGLTITFLWYLVISSSVNFHFAECAKKSSSSPPPSSNHVEPVIEEVNAKQLERILLDKDYVAVFWYTRSCVTCDKVLAELEKIDDETDSFGVDFVKINDKRLAKQYGIKNFPALTYFREKEPIIYDGDLMNEESLLDFLTSLEAMDLPDRIEEVNGKILSKIVDDTEYIAVLFCKYAILFIVFQTEYHYFCVTYIDKSDCKKSAKALMELENIDDEADQLGIAFVKINDEELANEYNLGELPKLVYYRHQIPIIYENSLAREEDVLEWLIENKSTGDDDDAIEDISSGRTLQTLITNAERLVVYFYIKDDEKSETILNELENIDDDLDKHGVQLVKSDYNNALPAYGVKKVPALVYFEKQEPLVYSDNLEDEEEVLAWLQEQFGSEEIEDVTSEGLEELVKSGKSVLALYYDSNDKKSSKILDLLEDIDDDLEEMDVEFVKIDSHEELKGNKGHLKLVLYEKGIPQNYDGNIANKDAILKWVQEETNSDEIEDITDEMLDDIIDKMGHVAVLFYDKDQKKSKNVLAELENIDDECDQHDIAFVKIDDEGEAKEWGIDEFPTLVFYEDGIPHVYEGDLMKEESVLNWLIHQKKFEEIPEITDEMKDKLIETEEHLAVIFYDKEDKQDIRILNELENIDDELEKEGIVIVRMDDEDEAKEYGLDALPALVYFENHIPTIYEGDLMNEEEVLEWLINQKNSDTIEEVTDEILLDLINEHEYVAVYFSGACDEGDKCDKILDDLENIDDELDEAGILFVTTEDTTLIKRFNIKNPPQLVLFRNKEVLSYTGDLSDEDEVLAWLTDENTLEIPGKIEEVNTKMLDKILAENDYVVVFFYLDGDKKAHKILNELENIDDECEEKDISFVKTSDEGIDDEYDIQSMPALAFYRHKIRTMYTGNLMNEDEILQWVLDLYESKVDVIESVDRKTLQVLIRDNDHLAVLFYSDDDCDDCEQVLEDLETIDDDTDKHGILFVKSDDEKLAHDIGIFSFPSLVYYETSVPIMYDGKFTADDVLSWIIEQKTDESIDEVDRAELLELIDSQDFLAIVFYDENDEKAQITLRHIELIDDEASEYGIMIVKCTDKLMAKKYGYRDLPGISYFRKGKLINYDGDIDDEEELLDWLTNPDNMQLTDRIESVNKRMFQKIRQTSDYVAVFFYSEDCKQCAKVLTEIEHIDDEADASGINFVKIHDKDMAKEFGIFALPAIVFFKTGSKEPLIYAGDLYEEESILNWLLTQRNPSGDFIEDLEGAKLRSLIEESSSIAVYFYTDDCEQCAGILEKLENIDDDCDRHKITFVKTQDFAVAEYYGVTDFPVLLYFEDNVPNVYEGPLNEEEEVLQWLIQQKTEERIELITRVMLESMVDETQYLAVYFYKPNCNICDQILERLEQIDDECDVFGIHMVKIQDAQLAKRYSIKTFPGLVYFRNGNPLLFEGDLNNEQSVLEWLIDDSNRELADEIEEVNDRMLDRLMNESPLLCVFFYDEDCVECDAILEALELIDGEADQFGIDFVKIANVEAAHKYGVVNIPSLVYFRKQKPLLYDGDLLQHEKILSWLTSQDIFEIKNEIEEVNKKMLDKLLTENEFISVYFYEQDQEESAVVLQKLENIDSETDNLDITFVKMSDARYARKWGVAKLPALVYFRKRFPSIYRGDLHSEEDVLEWLRKNRFRQPELNIFMYIIIAIAIGFVIYTAFLLRCFKVPPTPPPVQPVKG
ncbi:uncharacterized protein LOC134832452 isoform X2 [Culicoides brevitarsis]|uniref:uncharacterized protein LOC134832452 isoform X2 n=1 Tax=Culicoides brevitarsis TaxID=469753 RepID=UPI00307C4580